MVCCRRHDNERFCTTCLTDQNSQPPVQCMHCGCWLDSGITSYKLAPNHPSKFICTGLKTHTWNTCAEDDECWSHDHRDTLVICADCSHDAITCPCGDAWICGICVQEKSLKSGRHCPRCQRFYCLRGCAYIKTCTECEKTTLCDDCMEEEMTDEEESLNKGTIIMTTGMCECQRDICVDCFKKHAFCCGACNSVYCRAWRGDDGCAGCGALLCVGCMDDDECMGYEASLCPNCRGFGMSGV